MVERDSCCAGRESGFPSNRQHRAHGHITTNQLGFRQLDSDTGSYSNSSSKPHAVACADVDPGRQLANTKSDPRPECTKAQDKSSTDARHQGCRGATIPPTWHTYADEGAVRRTSGAISWRQLFPCCEVVTSSSEFPRETASRKLVVPQGKL